MLIYYILALEPPLPSPPFALQLDALVAVAHAIPALYRLEHPGNDTEGLGTDDLLPIFIFILVNSRIERVNGQSLILEALCDPKRKTGETGESIFSGIYKK